MINIGSRSLYGIYIRSRSFDDEIEDFHVANGNSYPIKDWRVPLVSLRLTYDAIELKNSIKIIDFRVSV